MPARIWTLALMGTSVVWAQPLTAWYGLRFSSAGQALTFESAPPGPDRAEEQPAQEGSHAPTDVGRPPTFYGHDVLTGCIVVGARLVYNAAADAPLVSPRQFSAPTPGLANSSQQGPVNGPEPGTNPVEFFTGNAFEYHSDLNHKDGCSSQQYKRALLLEVDKATGVVVRAQGNGFGARAGWPADTTRPGTNRPFARGLFDGSTSTGIKRFDGGVVYEGTPDKIHWLDAPGWLKTANGPGVNPANASVLIALLKSVTYGSNHDHGRLCYSGHTVVVDLATGRAMAPGAVTTMFAAAAPRGGVRSGPLKEAADTLRTPAAQGGFQGTSNPEFKDLGCYAF